MNKLNIQLNSNIEVVDTNTVAKLYLAATSISEPLEGELDLAYLSGNLLVNKTYRSLVDYLTDRFEDLNINVTDDYYIEFEDPEVFLVLQNYGYGDGIGITEGDARTITINTTAFKNNKNITEFLEYKFFKNNTCCSFLGCENLEKLALPNTITLIGTLYFDGCTSLRHVSIPNLEMWFKINFSSNNANPVMFSKHLYIEDEELTNLVIPSDIHTIKDSLFRNCEGITSVYIHDLVTQIGSNVFRDCTNLSQINDISSNTIVIGECVFLGSNLPNPVYSTSSFAYCPKSYTGAYVIPNGITKICGGAFKECTGLTSVTIPNTVTTINHGAFTGCTSLTSVVIPDSVTSFGNNNWVDGGVFSGCNNLSSIVLSNNILILGAHNFRDCTKLTSIIIPNGIKEIGTACFRNSGIKLFILPDSIETIRSYAIYLTSALTTIIGTGINYLESLSISDLRYVIIKALNPPTRLKNDAIGTGDIYVPNTALIDYRTAWPDAASRIVAIGSIITKFNILEANIPVLIISSDSSVQTSIFNSIEIDNSILENITKTYNFSTTGDHKINYLLADNTVITSNMFNGCSLLTTVKIPDGVTNIETNAFSSCTSLTQVIFPRTITYIENNAFASCTSLNDFRIDSIESLLSIVFENEYSNPITYVHRFSISGNTSMFSTLRIPNTVTSINDFVFNAANNLSYLTIPSTVTSIGNSSFKGCYNLKSITIETTTPPTLGTDAFTGTHASLIIYVPATAVDTYKAAPRWSTYASRIQAIPST